jgi:hypothetical protein
VGFSKQNDTDMIGAPQVPQMLNRQSGLKTVSSVRTQDADEFGMSEL